MTQLVNNVPLINPITPGSDDRNEWATHYAKFGAGGFEIVNTITDRNNITSDRKVDKMVYVKADNKTYTWDNQQNIWSEVKFTSEGIPQSVLDDIAANKANVNRLSSKINAEPDKVFTYRGKTLPNIPNTAMLGYYLTFYSLTANDLVIQFPDVDLPEGTVFSIDNNDRNDQISFKPRLGDRIDNKLNQTVVLPSNSVAFLVKKSGGWATAFLGLIPNDINRLVSAVKPLLPTSGTGLTIDEITAQLKDRLHTFAEIQTEFTNQLHTLSELEDAGFLKQSILAGYVDFKTIPTNYLWVSGNFLINEAFTLNATNSGLRYLALAIPVIMEPLIKKLLIDSVETAYTISDIKIGTEPIKKILISNNRIDSNTNHTIKFEIGIDDSSKGIEINDGIINIPDIQKINFRGGKIANKAANEIDLTAGLDIHMDSPNEQYGNSTATELIVMPPLNVWDDDSDPNSDTVARLEIKPGTYQDITAPSFLGYIKEDLEVIAKLDDSKLHHKGLVFMDDVICPSGSFITVDRVSKAYGLQDYTGNDPNVTGGVDFVVSFRAGMRGIAPNDGTVKIALIKKGFTPLTDNIGFLEDVNGNPMIIERFYKKGERLGVLETTSIVNAKGLQEFQCIVADDFANDNVILTDRTENGTGLMIQSIGYHKESNDKKGKTGVALLQYENDTNQNIEFSSHYLGKDRMDLGWVTQLDMPITEGNAKQGMLSNDGYSFYNLSPMKMGVANKELVFEDNGTPADFYFGKIFSAEETHLLKGKAIEVTISLENKDAAINLALVLWDGKSNEYTQEIFTRNNGIVSYNANWYEDTAEYLEKKPFSDNYTLKYAFTVPQSCNNYGIIIYPEQAQSPLNIKLKDLRLDVVEPFTGYILQANELTNELHLYNDDKYARFVQDNEVYAALRYTNTNRELPMPCGVKTIGNANIIVDNTVNQVQGSGATGGEGALSFNSNAVATIRTKILLWNEQSTESTVSYYWSKVSPDGGTFTKIIDSEVTCKVSPNNKGTYFTLPTFDINVQPDDRIALRSLDTRADGTFLESTDKTKPMLVVDIDLKEISTDQSDWSGTGVDLSGFNIIPQTTEYGIYQFANQDKVEIPLEIPEDVQAAVIAIQAQDPNTLQIRPIHNYDYVYDPNTKSFSFSFSKVLSGQIIIQFLQ